MKRIFIVGVARSGTTLLQSMLASHPDIHSFPESHFFDRSIPKQKYLRLLNFIGDKANNNVLNFLSNIKSKQSFKPLYTFSNKKWIKTILKLLDKEASFYGMKIWVEKTPLHLYYTDLISQVDNDAFFIHMIREGSGNITSLYEVSTKSPNDFKQNTLPLCINRYIKEINLSKSMIGKPNHCFIRYENLVQFPEDELKKIVNFLKLNYSDEMMSYKSTSHSIIQEHEVWKNNNFQNLQLSQKFKTLLSINEQKLVLKSLKGLDLNCFDV
tara:strand:- start:2554 stop:3360 length:807 start_codon:yes stop_codon:yes gene_type:complete